MTHIELAELPGPLLKQLAEYAASRGERLVIERRGGAVIYRLVRIGQP